MEVKLDTPVTIQGKGNSLWSKSGDLYVVERIELDYLAMEDDFACINMFGKNLGLQYTDTGIEKQVNKKLKSLIAKAFNLKIKNITWSEQGMQPPNGWNFDVILRAT